MLTDSLIHRLPPLITVNLCALVILAYAGLIPLSLWWADEYGVIPKFASASGNYFQLLEWIPRPFSNVLIAAYSFFVNRFHEQFIIPTLLSLWVSELLILVVTPLLLLKNRRSGSLGCTILSFSLFASFLLNHPVREMFYWPFGSFAYIPTLAGVCLTTWIYIFWTGSTRDYIVCATALTITATSSEIGALVAVILVFPQILLTEYAQFKNSPPLFNGRLFWLVLPLGSALWVLYAVAMGRVGSAGEVYGDPKIAHNLLQAILPAMETFLRGIFLADKTASLFSGLLYGFMTKLLYLIGTTLIFIAIAPYFKFEINRRYSAYLGIIFLASAYLIVLAGYYQYGLNCCERHSTFKDCLVFLALFSIAASLAKLCIDKNKFIRAPLAILGSAFIFTSIMIGISGDLPKVMQAYSGFSSKQEMIQNNWQSGFSSGKAMLFQQRDDPIVGGLLRDSGTYTLSNDVDWGVAAVMRFYGKESIQLISR